MASSLRTGLDGLIGWPDQVDAALIMLVDMPGMTAEALQRLREVDHRARWRWRPTTASAATLSCSAATTGPG